MAAVTERDVRIAVRAWLLAAAEDGGLDDAQVIHAESEGIRPSPPFAEIRVVTYRNPLDGSPERFDRGDPVVKRYVRTQSRDTVSVNTYGTGAQEWLARAAEFLWQPSMLSQLQAAGFTVDPIGAMHNLSGLLDDRYEIRFQQDFEVSYASLSDGETMVEAEQIEITDDIAGGDTYTVVAP